MIDFLVAAPFMRVALRVAMATMHFHILARTGLFLGNIYSHLGGPREQFAQMKNCPVGCKIG